MRSSTLHMVGNLEREKYEVRICERADDANTTPQPVQWLGWSSKSGVEIVESAYPKPSPGRRIGKVHSAGSGARNFLRLRSDVLFSRLDDLVEFLCFFDSWYRCLFGI